MKAKSDQIALTVLRDLLESKYGRNQRSLMTGGRLTEIHLIEIVFFQLIKSFIYVIFAFKKFRSTAKKEPMDFGS